MDDLRSQIRVLLADCDMDQRELAHFSGLSQATISNFLSGRKDDVKLSTVRKIAAALGCTATFEFSH